MLKGLIPAFYTSDKPVPNMVCGEKLPKWYQVDLVWRVHAPLLVSSYKFAYLAIRNLPKYCSCDDGATYAQ
ncbi:hypothetical protein VA249_07360 [Vibrio alfacsensis]|nr:hypothetical protein VA249_07360 [Vibrio alfacsensis]